MKSVCACPDAGRKEIKVMQRARGRKNLRIYIPFSVEWHFLQLLLPRPVALRQSGIYAAGATPSCMCIWLKMFLEGLEFLKKRSIVFSD
jgi:hypothetical protein